MSGKRILKVEILGDAKNAQGALDNLGKSASGLGSKIGSVAKVGAVGLAAIGVAAGAVAVSSLNSFREFEQGMDEVFTLLPGISDDAMGQMTDQVKGFSKEFGVLPDEVVPALYQSLSAGVPQDNVFEFLETAQKAAKGGVTELSTAVDGISSVINAYGTDVIQAGEASDLMFTAVKLGKTNFDELSRSLFNVIPTAASLGVGFGDVTAALATLTAQGTPTSVATTQIRQALVEASKSGSELDKSIRELTGSGFTELIEGGQDIGTIFQTLRDGMPEQEFRDLFGSVEAMNAVLGITGGNFETFSDNLDEMGESAGATDAAFETMDSGLNSSLAKIRANFEVLKLEIGERLAPVVANLLSLFLDQGIPALQRAAAAVMQFAEPIQNLARFGFTALRDGFLTFVQALQGNWADAEGIRPLHSALGNIGLIIREQVIPFVREMADVFINQVVPAVVNFATTTWTLLTTQVIPAIVNFGTMAFDIFQNQIVPAVIALKDAAFAAFENVIKPAIESFTTDILPRLVEAWNQINAEVIPTLVALQSHITTVFGFISEFITTHWETISEVTSRVWEFVSTAVGNAITIISNVIQLAMNVIQGDWAGAWENIKTIAITQFDQLKNWFSLFKDWFTTWFTQIVPLIVEKVGEWGAAFVGWVVDAIPDLLLKLGELELQLIGWIRDTALPAIIEQISAWAGAFTQWALDAIPDLLVKLGTLYFELEKWVLTTALPAIVVALAEWGWAFLNWITKDVIPWLVPELWKIANDLNAWVVDTALPTIIEKLTEWGGAFLDWVVKDVIPFLVTELGKISEDINSWIIDTALPTIIAKLVEWGAAFLDWVADEVIPYLFDKLEAIVTEIGTWIGDAVTRLPGMMASVGIAVLQGIADGIINNASSIVGGAIDGALNLIPGWAKDALGISSPSKVMIPVGEATMDGVAVGVENGFGVLAAAIREIFLGPGGFIEVFKEAVDASLRKLVAIIEKLFKSISDTAYDSVYDSGYDLGVGYGDGFQDGIDDNPPTVSGPGGSTGPSIPDPTEPSIIDPPPAPPNNLPGLGSGSATGLGPVDTSGPQVQAPPGPGYVSTPVPVGIQGPPPSGPQLTGAQQPQTINLYLAPDEKEPLTSWVTDGVSTNVANQVKPPLAGTV